jgi:hypothetical protein
MDLSKLTWLELIELRSKINEEIKTVENRAKIQAFSVIAYDVKNVFLNYEKAKAYLLECLSDDELFNDFDTLSFNSIFIDEAYSKYCKDYGNP